MKQKIDRFRFPPNLEELVRNRGSWDSDALHPFFVHVAAEDEGELSFQISIEARDTAGLGRMGKRLAAEDVTGQDWELDLRAFLKHVFPELEKLVHGDSSDETLCIWVQGPDPELAEHGFRALLHASWAFFNEPAAHFEARIG